MGAFLRCGEGSTGFGTSGAAGTSKALSHDGGFACVVSATSAASASAASVSAAAAAAAAAALRRRSSS